MKFRAIKAFIGTHFYEEGEETSLVRVSILKDGRISVKTQDEDTKRWTVWQYPDLIHIKNPKFKKGYIEGFVANYPCPNFAKCHDVKIENKTFRSKQTAESIKLAKYCSIKKGGEILALPLNYDEVFV